MTRQHRDRRRTKSQLRRAATLLSYWNGDQLFFHNFATRLTTASSPITCEVLHFFSSWRTYDEAVDHFASYSGKSVRTAISQLVAHGLLVRKNSAEAARDKRIAIQWGPWLPAGSFHFSTKDTPFIDPSNWSVARLKEYLPQTAQPEKFSIIRGAPKTSLPPRSFPDSEFIRVLMARKTHRQFARRALTFEQVSQLLSLVWGVTGYLHSPSYGKLFHKTSPSGGARHPIEVYLMALRVKGLNRGLYHYDSVHHRLEGIRAHVTSKDAWLYCARQHFVKSTAALFIMTAVFPRTMWKYRHPRAYRVVLLDAGHLCQTFCLVATWLGLAPFCTAALKDTLIEKDLGIDGIRESVLYVAGVGLPATSARVRRRFSRSADRRAANPNKDEA